MKDKAPGPDCVPSVHNKLWDHAGPLILNSWNYSNEKNELSREQQLSTIMLLEKKGKKYGTSNFASKVLWQKNRDQEKGKMH